MERLVAKEIWQHGETRYRLEHSRPTPFREHLRSASRRFAQEPPAAGFPELQRGTSRRVDSPTGHGYSTGRSRSAGHGRSHPVVSAVALARWAAALLGLSPCSASTVYGFSRNSF